MQFCCTDRCCIPFSFSISLFHFIWGMRRACIAVLASLRVLDTHAHTTWTTCSRHGIPHTSTTDSRYPGIQAAYFSLRQLSQLQSNTDSSAVVTATTQHNARHCKLHIAVMIQRNDARLRNSGTCKRNNLRLTALFEQGRNDGFQV